MINSKLLHLLHKCQWPYSFIHIIKHYSLRNHTLKNYALKNIVRPSFLTSYKQRGFSLIELMVTVSIVGIITTVAVSSYREQVLRANRAEGKNFLLEIADAQEQFMTKYVSYSNIIESPAACTLQDCGLDKQTESKTQKYSMTMDLTPSGCSAAGAVRCRGYTLTATPTFPDVKCGGLTYSHHQIQGLSAGDDEDLIDQCWR